MLRRSLATGPVWLASAAAPAAGSGCRAGRLLGAVDGDDAAAEVAVGDGLPAGFLQPGRQVVLVRPGADGLGEVDVGVRVGGDLDGDGGQRAHQVFGVHGAPERHHRLGELGDDQPAAGLGDPEHLGEGLLGLVDVAQAEGDGAGVEGVVREGQAGGVAGDEVDVRAAALADLEHAQGEVAGDTSMPASAYGSLEVPVPAARSSTRWPAFTSMASTTIRRQRRVCPIDRTSLTTSYLGATSSNIVATSSGRLSKDARFTPLLSQIFDAPPNHRAGRGAASGGSSVVSS